MKGQRVIYHGCRLLLAGVFLYAGAQKSQDVAAFAGSVAGYHLLPYAWNYLVAAILPYVELLAGILLLADARVRPALLLLAFLTATFMLALASAAVRGLDIDCGCFNPAARTSPLAALVRDAGILFLIVLAWRLRRPPASAPPPVE